MKCFLCNNEMKEKVLFYECQECGICTKIKTINEEEEKKRYLYHTYDENYENYIKKSLSVVLKDLKNIDLLDYGCGRYPVLDKIFKDINIIYYDKYFIKNDYTKYQYDVILLNEVLEHIKNPFLELQNLKKFLKIDGYFIIHTILFDELTNFNNWWYTRDATHVTFFNKKGIENLGKKLNMNVYYKEDFIILKN